MIKGSYYDGITSKPHPAELLVNEQGQACLSEVMTDQYPFESLNISSRIGNTIRTIRFPNKARFETLENDKIDLLVKKHAQPYSKLFSIHHWESKLKLIVTATIVTAALLAVFVSVGIPAASKAIAHKLPAHIASSLAQDVVEEFDDGYFEKTELDTQKRKHISELFKTFIPVDSDFNYRLLFRNDKRSSANAMALPDGTIIITDSLVNLSSSNEEIIAVLLHEIGHIEARHSLRDLVETTGLYAMYSWMTGDIETSSVVLLALSGALIKSRYSRKHESEADAYAIDKLLAHKINPAYFASIMRKITQANKMIPGKEDASNDEPVEEKDTAGSSDEQQKNGAISREITETILDYLSSHPAAQKRIEIFEDAASNNGYPILTSE